LLGGECVECASDHDDINLERNEFGHVSGEPLELPLVTSVFDHDVAALDVAEITQSLAEGLALAGASGPAGPQVAYSSDLPRLLRLGEERPGERASQRGQQEEAAVHYSIT
jgi:hypothetical protein